MRIFILSDEQMVNILLEADRAPVPMWLCGSDQWPEDLHMPTHFSRMNAHDVKKLRQQEQENVRLKKLLTDRDLGIRCEGNGRKW